MRRAKISIFTLLCFLIPLTAYAENKKISISCEDLVAIDIKQPPPRYAFPDETCGDKCFYIDFIMTDTAAQKLNVAYNANKHVMRDLCIDDLYLFTADPFHLEVPYSEVVSSATIYRTLEDAVDDM